MKAARVTSVDVLRGVIMVVMALDHVRDYVHLRIDPTDLATTSIPLFATRWITHFCAPVFMLLAGVGAYLQLTRGKTRRDLAVFLVTRGLWLVVLELTVIRCLGWFWNFDYHIVALIVIWALGISMIVLAALIWLPRTLLAAICIAAIAGHNLLDAYEPAGSFDWLWKIVHATGVMTPSDGTLVFVPYVLVPWVFVMGLGYAIGPVFTWEPQRRAQTLVRTGLAITAAFLVIRGINLYGDPDPWVRQGDLGMTIVSFLNCTKYAPSLDYLMMTLGPATLALGLLEHARGPVARWFETFGKVPLFYYLLHLPLIHAVAFALALTRYDELGFMFDDPMGPTMPATYGYPLWITYLVWIGCVAALYLPCRWFAEYKRTHRAVWLSYL